MPESAADFRIEPLRAENAAAVAGLHLEHFASGETVGNSVAKFGREFTETVFYRLNLANPHFFGSVAIYRGEAIGFSVYTTDRKRVFRWMLRRRFVPVVFATLEALLRRPSILPMVLSNLRYGGGGEKLIADAVQGWWIVAAVSPRYRGKEFMEETGVHVADALYRHMEATFARERCRSWYGVVHPENGPINAFLKRRGAREIGRARAQGMEMAYYVWKEEAQ